MGYHDNGVCDYMVQAFRLFSATVRLMAHKAGLASNGALFKGWGSRGISSSVPPCSLQSLQQPPAGAVTKPSKQGSDVTSDELFCGSFIGPSVTRQVATDNRSLVQSLVHSQLASQKNQQRDLLIIISLLGWMCSPSFQLLSCHVPSCELYSARH
ncbi:hypothetical protein LZ31DRAFT_199891 [Colletotrichum somersetense]|nr:hypothetical protein LZ31DRAFT_199891 [Colletotrichum somersetense]